MSDRPIDFLVGLSGKSPRNLAESIRRVKNASAGFLQSWHAGSHAEAYETSQEAFEHLDYIQNELLRQRDVHRMNQAIWQNSLFRLALQRPVGSIVKDLQPPDSAWFASLALGYGALPVGVTPTPLTLETALNKLKHRDTIAVNFSASPIHALFVNTSASMNQKESLCEISVLVLCQECLAAAAHV